MTHYMIDREILEKATEKTIKQLKKCETFSEFIGMLEISKYELLNLKKELADRGGGEKCD